MILDGRKFISYDKLYGHSVYNFITQGKGSPPLEGVRLDSGRAEGSMFCLSITVSQRSRNKRKRGAEQSKQKVRVGASADILPARYV